MALTEGSNLGPFRILGQLGRGGMASVYKAYEPGLDRSVAVKVLPAEFLHEPTFAERFKREAQVVAKLEHPNIIPIYAYGIDDGLPWMSMRLIAGGALYGILKQSGRLKPARMLHFLRSVADALDYAHAAGVVHRDIKPQNILVDERDHVYLADFGLAKMVEGAPGLTQTGMITGTPEYMAPEQAMGQAVDRRVDIYSLGVVAYACGTGRVPFTADTPLAVLMKHVRDPIPLPPAEEVPEPLTRVLLKALAKAPGERWPTAGAFVDAVAKSCDIPTVRMAALEAPTTIVKAPPVPRASPADGEGLRTHEHRGRVSDRPSTRQGSTRRVVLAVVAGLLLVAAAAVGTLLWAVRRKPPEEASAAASSGGGLATQPAATPRQSIPTVQPAPQAVASQPGAMRTPAVTEPASVSQAPPPSVPTPRTAREAPRSTAERQPPPFVTQPTRATASAPAHSEPSTPASAPVATVTTPERPAARPGTPYSVGPKIPLGLTQGLVHLDTVLFKLDRNRTELQAEVAGHCDKGKDQAVEIQLEMLDASGQTVTSLRGKGGIEEGDNGTIKAKQKLTPDQLARIASFRISFDVRPD